MRQAGSLRSWRWNLSADEAPEHLCEAKSIWRGENWKGWQRLREQRWWQLKHFGHFHHENWGNDPIWRAYFSDGLKPPTREERWEEEDLGTPYEFWNFMTFSEISSKVCYRIDVRLKSMLKYNVWDLFKFAKSGAKFSGICRVSTSIFPFIDRCEVHREKTDHLDNTCWPHPHLSRGVFFWTSQKSATGVSQGLSWFIGFVLVHR